MLIGRNAELTLLEGQYALTGNNLVILYGRKGMGKTALISEFLKEKPSVYYYEGTECVDKLQRSLMNRQASDHLGLIGDLDYPLLFSELISKQKEKTIIVLDEFHTIIKNSPDFYQTFHLLDNREFPVMFLLCSSSIRWAENEMISDLGFAASGITAYVKLKEFTFMDFVARFPNASVETCIYINAILGGVPEYLNVWRESRSIRENIIELLLNKDSRLFEAPEQFLKLELRETAVYNTILSCLAQGNRKLNDLYNRTGFSRAKISVYLKNLTELDLVEKLSPLGEEGKENAKKGLYRIKDNFINFWYRFAFPNLSDLMIGKAEEVYEEKVAPFLDEYMGEYFADVCTEFLKLMNNHGRLAENFLWWDRWYGKNGTLDILAQGESGKTLAGRCIWEERKADRHDYDELISLTKDAQKTCDYCYLFSKKGFTEKLKELKNQNKNITLIELDDL